MKKEVEKYNQTQLKTMKRSKYNVRTVPVGCILRNSFGTGIKNKQTSEQTKMGGWMGGSMDGWMEGEGGKEGGSEGGRERRKILMSSFFLLLISGP